MREVAAHFGVLPSTVRAWYRTKRLVGLERFDTVVFHVDVIAKFVAPQKQWLESVHAAHEQRRVS